MTHVDTERTGSILKVTLNDPATLNSMGRDMIRELRQVIQDAAKPGQGIRCLVLTGAGRGFCSGGNLGLMTPDQPDHEPMEQITLGTHHHYVLKLMKSLPYPVLTAVNGPAAGVGFSFALAGDLVVASRSAYFLAAFRNIGVSPDGGLSWMLPKSIGWARAKELLLMGNRLPADEALEWGLINRVFEYDTFTEDTMAFAEALAAGPTVALGVIRQLAWESWESTFANQLDREEILQLETFASDDARHGARALLNKEKPTFNGC